MNAAHTEVWVLGLGTSGDAAARLLRREGRRVRVLDRRADGAVAERAAALETLGIDAELGVQMLPAGTPDLAVVSPGIEERSPWLHDLRLRGIACRSEIEVAWERRQAKVIAVTGSNGKTTAASMLDHVLRTGGILSVLGGNCGPPLSSVVMREADWWVVEVSSFQLETVEEFRPDVGVLLNVQPNHLDRHGTMQSYLRTKARLFAATLPEDLCLVPHSQAQQVRKVAGGRGTWVSFGGEEDAGFRYHQGVVWHEGTPVADVRASEFANEVTGPMVCAVAACGRRAGMNWAAIERGIAGFRGLPHRMQRLGAVNQVEYVNDSKSTSLSALSAALTRLREPIRLIAGGVLKEDNVMVPADALRRRVAAAYLIGEGAAVLHAAWSGFVECRVYPTLEEAFAGAHRDARPGETILLSPGAASFDQFANYRERGKRFEALVEQAARTDAGTGCNVKPIDNTEGCARMAECRNEKKEKCA